MDHPLWTPLDHSPPPTTYLVLGRRRSAVAVADLQHGCRSTVRGQRRAAANAALLRACMSGRQLLPSS